MVEIKIKADVIIKSGLTDMSPAKIALAVEEALNQHETIPIAGSNCSKPYVGLRVHFNEIDIKEL